MVPSWMLLWSVLVLLAGSSELDRCPIILQEPLSPLLLSLRCYNNYRSYVHCEWSEPGNSSLQLWFQIKDNRSRCWRYGAPEQDGGGPRNAQCRYLTSVLGIGIRHTAFFMEDTTEQFCQLKPVNLSQLLRTRPPVNLSTHATATGCRLRWSQPYPPSSSLNKDMEYQLSYRGEGGNMWMTEIVRNTSVRIEKRGCKFEARVRARVSVGHWSDWAPAALSRTEEAAGRRRPPSLSCELVGEKEVKCSWEVSGDVSGAITHQLLCRRGRAAATERCCLNQSVNSDPGGRVLQHSCWLTAAEPGNLLLELLPEHNARTFSASQHIRPDPPETVTVRVREKTSNWVVEWTNASGVSKVQVYYQLCYYRKSEEECSLQNVSNGATSFNILQASLVPSQEYRVKVRSLVFPGDESIYRGIPSEWSGPATWTSHEATWSPDTLIYFSISAIVATVFCVMYCAATACQRKVILWVDSIPSPGKSKIMSEIHVVKSPTQTLLKKPFLGKDRHFDSMLTCSTDVSLWSNKDGEPKHSLQDDGCWECDNQPFVCDHGNGSESSCMGFSGLYILCWESQLHAVRDSPSPSEDPAALRFTVGERDYVHLPGHSTCSSEQQHFSQSDVVANPRWDHGEQQHQQCPLDTGQVPDEAEDEPDIAEPLREPPCSSSSLPAMASGPFTGWPQGVSVQGSGYCQLPTGHA